MQQRASLCRAIVHDPKLVMLDEPFAAVDAFTKEDLCALMQDLWLRNKFTAILVTHDLREAVFLADCVYVMSARPGRIVYRRAIDLPRPRTIEMTFEQVYVDHVHALREKISEVRGAMSKRLMRHARPWLVAIGLLLVWEIGCRVASVPSFVLPRPSQIIAAMWEFREPLLTNSLQTLFTTMIGFAIAVAVGILLGVAIGTSTAVYESLYPTLIAFNAIPKVALVPVIVIWCGIGTVPAIITAATLAFFPIVVNVATGLATVEPELRDVLRSLGATRYEMLSKVGIPRSLPYLFASLKIAVTLAFIGSVIAETVAAELRDRLPDAVGVGEFPGAARVCRPDRAGHHERHHLPAVLGVRAAHDRLGVPRTACQLTKM